MPNKKIRTGILFIIGWLPCFSQPADPILKIESGMHSAKCNSISSDANGQYLLSCSDDRTARFWDASSGELLKILRVPVGATEEGKLNGCALSPDGKMAAVGGYTGEWENDDCIYIIDPFSGQIIKTLCNLPNVINRLVFSKDGEWLAAGLGAGGVRVYNTVTWQVKELSGYHDQVYGLSFNKDNMLVTACFDNTLRLYQLPGFSMLAQTANLHGDKPYSVAFNAAGNLIAVGYDKTAVAEVFYTKNLQPAYLPDVSGVPAYEEISSVSFSSDGNTLYAGGSFRLNNINSSRKYTVRKWEDAGKGSFEDLPLLENTVMAIRPLPNGNMMVLGSSPDMAVIAPSGHTAWYRAADNINFAVTNPARFIMSADGNAISATSKTGDLVSFSIANRSLYQNNFSYQAPVMAKDNIVITSWQNTPVPAINNVPLRFLNENETCRTACISNTGNAVAWGTDWNLYLTGSGGNVIWKTPLPEAAYAVNIAADGKIICALLGDGTIRWYNLVNGKELLILFLNKDKQRWILFTPQGYYDASPGGEDLLGWHVNNGPATAPSFFPASRFKKTYYRPDIINAITQSWDENMAITLSNQLANKTGSIQTITAQKLPPTIIINSPASGSVISADMIAITYSIQQVKDAPAANITVLVNGRPATSNVQRGVIVASDKEQTIQVNVPKENCVVSLLAENRYGMSPPADVHLKYNAAQQEPAFQKKPVLYILAIGVSNYSNPDYKLKYAAEDATGFAAVFARQKGLLYEDVVIKKLVDNDATLGNIQDGLEWIQQQTTSKDVVMIFFAGHGVNDNTGFFYMAPVGADMNHLLRTCLNFQDLTRTVSSIAGKVVVFIDACHSGDVMGGRRSLGDINGVVNDLASTTNGSVVFTSSTGKEYSLEDASWKHGAFTKALIEGMEGGAVIQGKSKITIKSLDVFIAEKVKDLTRGRQHPVTVVAPNVPDFPLAVQP